MRRACHRCWNVTLGYRRRCVVELTRSAWQPFPRPVSCPAPWLRRKRPGDLSADQIIRAMYEWHGTVIAGSRNKLGGNVIRIGTMGDIHDSDIVTDLLHLESVLAELGWPLTAGAGVTRGMEVLDGR
jgi:hypothetical protein